MESPQARWKALRPDGKPSILYVFFQQTILLLEKKYVLATALTLRILLSLQWKRRGASCKQNWAEDLRPFKPLLSDKPNGIFFRPPLHISMCFSSFVPCLPAGLLPFDQKQHPQIHSTFHSESACVTPTSIITIAHVSPLTCKQVDGLYYLFTPTVWWCMVMSKIKPSFLGYGCLHRKPPLCWCCETQQKTPHVSREILRDAVIIKLRYDLLARDRYSWRPQF